MVGRNKSSGCLTESFIIYTQYSLYTFRVRVGKLLSPFHKGKFDCPAWQNLSLSKVLAKTTSCHRRHHHHQHHHHHHHPHPHHHHHPHPHPHHHHHHHHHRHHHDEKWLSRLKWSSWTYHSYVFEMSLLCCIVGSWSFQNDSTHHFSQMLPKKLHCAAWREPIVLKVLGRNSIAACLDMNLPCYSKRSSEETVCLSARPWKPLSRTKQSSLVSLDINPQF